MGASVHAGSRVPARVLRLACSLMMTGPIGICRPGVQEKGGGRRTGV